MTSTKKIIAQYYSGTSGLVLPFSKQYFPEEYKNASRLTYYSTLLNSLEVNSIFYKLPLEKTVEKWASEVREDFKFTFKLWQAITHAMNFDFNRRDVDRFFEIVNGADTKKGCILIQLPPSVTDGKLKTLELLLNHIAENDKNGGWKIAVEFRNKSWYNDDVYELLREKNTALVLHDMPKSASPLITDLADFIYLRFHGPTGNYAGSYEDHYLHEYAGYVNEWRSAGKTVYTYFNNTIGSAFTNLQRLNSYIK